MPRAACKSPRERAICACRIRKPGDDDLGAEIGDNELSGGPGNDAIFGGDGNDTFRFGRGDGNDNVVDFSGVNRVLLDADVTPGDVTLYRTSGVGQVFEEAGRPASISDDLVIALDSGDQMQIRDHYSIGAISQIVFADGTIWNASDIDARVVHLEGFGTRNLIASLGDDHYFVDHRDDQVFEPADGGTDTITSNVTFSLPENVENLILTGPLAIGAQGNALDNMIQGNDQINYLDARFTAGVDTLIGGRGDDRYFVNAPERTVTPNFDDIVIEQVGGGYDIIWVEGVYSAAMPENVEKMVVAGRPFVSSSLARTFTGNALDNVIDARIAHSDGQDVVIDGGLGADLLIGEEGSNSGAYTFIVDNVSDVVIGTERPDDTIKSTVSYTLSEWVEDLELWGTAGISAKGNVLDNRLTGNLADNIIKGESGNDILIGDAGNDLLDGGAGADVLNGQEGDDTFLFGFTSGQDTLLGAASTDTVVFGAGVTATGLIVTSVDSNLIIALNDLDVLTVDGWHFGERPGVFEFSDGSTLTAAEMEALVNNAPTVSNPPADQVGAEGGVFTYTLAADTFNDVDAEDHLTYSASLSDGSPLPSWLTFNPDTRSFSGLPGPGDNGVYVLQVTATDRADASVSANFSLTVADTLTAPILGTTGADTVRGTQKGDDALLGLGGDDTLMGRNGADYHDGGTGADTLSGESGDDVYVVGESGDVVTEANGEGTDTVLSSITYSLPANVENLILFGGADVDATGNDLNNALTGNIGDNSLSGGLGNDELSGLTGNDALAGGLGDDAYSFAAEHGHDTIQESGGASDQVNISAERLDLILTQEGTDLVLSRYNADDSIRVEDWYSDTANQVEAINALESGQVLYTASHLRGRAAGILPAEMPAPRQERSRPTARTPR